MKQEMELFSNAPAKIFFKLTVIGGFLLGFAYIAMIIMNSALKAIH